MNNQDLSKTLLRLSKELTSADTYKCPNCGTKVLKQTNYCVKCKEKVQDK